MGVVATVLPFKVNVKLLNVVSNQLPIFTSEVTGVELTRKEKLHDSFAALSVVVGALAFHTPLALTVKDSAEAFIAANASATTNPSTHAELALIKRRSFTMPPLINETIDDSPRRSLFAAGTLPTRTLSNLKKKFEASLMLFRV
jgi:hypothetical protein